jgi:hypothetical protein
LGAEHREQADARSVQRRRREVFRRQGHRQLRRQGGQGGGALAGYTGDDQLNYYNPTGTKRAKFPWREHFIGIQVTHTELKIDGINVTEDGADQTTQDMDGREEHVLANLLDEKMDDLGEDYAFSLDRLLHGDGSTDAKAIAGVASIIVDSPSVGSTGSLSRIANPYWRNRAATVANAGPAVRARSPATPLGGALIDVLGGRMAAAFEVPQGHDEVQAVRRLGLHSAYRKEMRANGFYTMTGLKGSAVTVRRATSSGRESRFEWDPTLDDIGLSKRCTSST